MCRGSPPLSACDWVSRVQKRGNTEQNTASGERYFCVSCGHSNEPKFTCGSVLCACYMTVSLFIINRMVLLLIFNEKGSLY